MELKKRIIALDIGTKRIGIATCDALWMSANPLKTINRGNDKEALDMYRTYQRMYMDGKKKYENEFGPLNHMSESGEKYRWLDDPWPWEYCANREG